MDTWSVKQPTVRPLPDRAVAVVLGTRPEIIKLAGVIQGLGRAARIVHTGQHYDEQMSDVFFAELGLPEPDVHLDVGGASRGGQVGRVLAALDAHLASDRPLAVVVQGDTNSTLAGALAGNAQDIPVVHVEAGLRSFDRRMPEEHNRVVTDHLSDVLCAPTPTSVQNLAREGIQGDHVVLTGNTVVEAVARMLPEEPARRAILDEVGVTPNGYVLATIHRPENADDRDALAAILTELAALPMPVVLPLHPRTAAAVERHGLSHLLSRLRTIEPLGSRRFLGLARHAAVLVSDSGGVQEECTILKRPLVVVRRSTERPESLRDFAVLVEPGEGIGKTARMWLDDLTEVHDRLAAAPCPYGDGTASVRIVAEIVRLLSSHATAFDTAVDHG